MTRDGQIVCSIFHRKSWTWYGHGDWRIQHCQKCGDKWVVMAHAVKGQRKCSIEAGEHKP